MVSIQYFNIANTYSTSNNVLNHNNNKSANEMVFRCQSRLLNFSFPIETLQSNMYLFKWFPSERMENEKKTNENEKAMSFQSSAFHKTKPFRKLNACIHPSIHSPLPYYKIIIDTMNLSLTRVTILILHVSNQNGGALYSVFGFAA